ncbi:hypothetical protein N0V90_011336 [Kalmusia sp. IMI 367209]|nr:hypothetical protein N0V90_011336 [Kalmusia sp. IMI 367209]
MARLTRKVTGEGTSYKHHCATCKKPATDKCLTQYHMAYCEYPSCGKLFNLKSRGGCSSHPYSEGYNKEARNLSKGLPADNQTAYEVEQILEKQEADERVADEAEMQAQEALEFRIENEYDKDWKKEDAKRKEKVTRPTKKERLKEMKIARKDTAQ